MNIDIAKKILCIGLSSVFCIVGAFARTVTDNKVSVSDLVVSRSENTLFVSMNIDVSDVKVKSN